MTRTVRIFAFVLTLATLVAGCASDPATPGTATPSVSPETSTPTPVDMATPTPVLTSEMTPSPEPPTEVTPTPETPTPAAPSFSIETSGVPASVNVGEDISFTMFVNGSETHESDHIGAHYGPNSTVGTNETPSTSVYTSTCIHVKGSAPGEFNVTCPNPKAGTFWLRGHARVEGAEGELLNFWSNESRVLVIGNMTLTTDIPTAGGLARVGQAFTFNLTSTGEGNFTSDHMGAHWNATTHATEAPAVSRYGQSCAHQAGQLPSVIQVTCTFTEVGTVFLRGHARITDSDAKQYDFWAPEQTITVTL